MTKQGTLVLVILIIAVGAGLLIWKLGPTTSEPVLVASFEECVAAGYPVAESMPRVCSTPEGNSFIEGEAVITPNPEPEDLEAPIPGNLGACYVGGCSGQICSDQKGVASTCEYREEYACYKTAECERQSNGKCGWTQTESLRMCLLNAVPKGSVTGHVTIGPNCPGPQSEEECPTPASAYTSREVIVYSSNGVNILHRVRLNSEGNYSITLAPGTYLLQVSPGGIRPSEKKAAVVKSNETTTLNFDIDTGIR